MHESSFAANLLGGLQFYFIVFAAMGYWEIDGKRVSVETAEYGFHPKAVWIPQSFVAGGRSPERVTLICP